MAGKPQSFAFVPVNSSGKTRISDRKLIRSHCMRGKNLRIGVRPIPTPKAVQSHQNDVNSACLSSLPFSLLPSQFPVEIHPGEGKNGTERHELMYSIPPPCPPALALVRLACDVDRDSQELIFSCAYKTHQTPWLYHTFCAYLLIAMTHGKESMYPLELSIDFDLCKSLWFQWAFYDPAYLYCVLYGASATRDYMQRKPSRLTHSHLNNTIKYLNQSFSDSTLATCDSTVAVIITLTMIADILQDQAAVMAHVAGLKWIVRERGGLDAFRHNPKLHIKIGRIDLAHSLTTGENPPYFNDPVPLDPIFKLSGLSCAPYGQDPELYGLKDERVAAIFRDLQYYSTLINQARATKQKRPAAEFQNVICSIQYRLIQLKGSLDDILAECLRLAMLAFLTTTFRARGQKPRYRYLAKQFQECCLAIEVVTPPLENLMLWLLIVGAISLWDIENEWLVKRWSSIIGRMPWSQAKKHLKLIMWFDAIHDGPGSHAFESLNRLRTGPTTSEQ